MSDFFPLWMKRERRRKNHLPHIHFEFGHVYRVYAIIKQRFIINWLEIFMNIHIECYRTEVCAHCGCQFLWPSINDVWVCVFFFSMNVQMTKYRSSKSIRFDVSAFFNALKWLCPVRILVSYCFNTLHFRPVRQMNMPHSNSQGGCQTA